MGTEYSLQPDHRVNHRVLDFRPFRLVAPVPARHFVSNPTTSFVVEPLPCQLAAERAFNLFLLAMQPVENPLVRFLLIRSTIDPKFDSTLVLTDYVVKRQSAHARTGSDPAIFTRRNVGVSRGLDFRTAEQSFPESLAQVVAFGLVPRTGLALRLQTPLWPCEALARVGKCTRFSARALVLPKAPTIGVHPTPDNCGAGGLGRRRASIVMMLLEFNRPIGEKPCFQVPALVPAEQ